MKKTIDFIKARKIALIIVACLFAVGIVFNCIFGTSLSIEFKGGTIIKYSYTGKLSADDVQKLAADTLKTKVTTDLTSDFSGDTKLVSITLTDNASVSTDSITALDTAMEEKFADNKITNVSTNSVNPTLGKGFFIKCIFATVLGALLITVYVGIRFRKIGGVSAAICALLCLMHDILIAYFTYVICRFPLDNNFIAVLLVLFGYSLNGTIVVYDRFRENRKLYGKNKSISEIVNMSVNQTFSRNLLTSLSTVIALTAVCVVAWFGGVDSIISFAFPMTVGIVAGCFSSVFLSTPIWAWWREFKGDPAENKKAKKAARFAKKQEKLRAKKAKAR